MSRKDFQYLGGHSERAARGGLVLCECGKPMTVRTATAENPYVYSLSGMKDVVLVGIQVLSCPGCRAEGARIPRIGQLHRVIVKSLIEQPEPLRGDQVRFLRKNAGFPAQKFAALLKIDPSYLSRVETGKLPNLGASTDRLARAVVIAESSGGEMAREILLDMAKKNQLEQKAKKTKKGQVLLFTLRGDRWAA
jgi:transcriptional regulator with XRE-family HTH domain